MSAVERVFVFSRIFWPVNFKSNYIERRNIRTKGTLKWIRTSKLCVCSYSSMMFLQSVWIFSCTSAESDSKCKLSVKIFPEMSAETNSEFDGNSSFATHVNDNKSNYYLKRYLYYKLSPRTKSVKQFFFIPAAGVVHFLLSPGELENVHLVDGLKFVIIGKF